MPFFLYQARDKKGNLIKGQVEAPNANAAADILVGRQEIPVKITLTDEAPDRDVFADLFSRVKVDDLVVFSRQMYSLTKAGIPLIRAIVGLADTTTNKTLKRVLRDGRSLSASFSSHPKVFPQIAISIVHVGENTGRLEDAFIQLAEYFERDEETRKRINAALRYPSMVLIFITAAMFLLNLKVIPTFSGMFRKLGADLPLATKILINMSDFFVNYWQILLLAIVGAIMALRAYVGTPTGKYQWDRYKIKLPFVGSIIERSLLARFSRSFAMILDAGVPMTTGLSLVAEAVDNRYMETKIKEMRRSIEKGESLLRVSVASGLFSPLVLQMIAVGEETGRVDELLTDASEYYEREVDYDLKSLTAKIEPVLISVVAVMVLILALGIFTPMWDMMSAYK
jgi:MSHA biogenesis protein MshG